MKRKLIEQKKVWDYGFGFHVETHPQTDAPHIVTNKNDEIYNVYDSDGRYLGTVANGEHCTVFKIKRRSDRVYGYLVHINSLTTTVIWKKKATMLKGLPGVVERRYREEKLKWIETLKAMREMHLPISTTDIRGQNMYVGPIGSSLFETGVVDKYGYVINPGKLHKSIPLITMDSMYSINKIRRQVRNVFFRKTETILDGHHWQPDDTLDLWFMRKGWDENRVYQMNNTETARTTQGNTLQQLFDAMSAKAKEMGYND